jgi:hypothetical protein
VLLCSSLSCAWQSLKGCKCVSSKSISPIFSASLKEGAMFYGNEGAVMRGCIMLINPCVYCPLSIMSPQGFPLGPRPPAVLHCSRVIYALVLVGHAVNRGDANVAYQSKVV